VACGSTWPSQVDRAGSRASTSAPDRYQLISVLTAKVWR